MAEWAASGYISAFARSSNSPNNLGFMPREYALSTNGLIDAQGITRYGVALRIPSSFWASHPTATPSRITARVSIAFDSTDTTEAAFWSQGDGNWRLGVVMFCMPASALTDPEAVPTPAAIISGATRTYRSSSTRDTPGTLTVDRLNGPFAQDLTKGEKWWFAVSPMYWRSGADWSAGVSAGVIWGDGVSGNRNQTNRLRGVSLWTARTPRAPVITSPGPVTTVGPGGSFTLSYTPQGDDVLTGYPTDTPKTLALDLAGVQAQVSPVPTPANPNPAWEDLQVRGGAADSRMYPAWYIEDVSGAAAPPVTSGAADLWENQSLVIRCGSLPGTSEGYLPPGKWRIRLRTMSYGHPYRRIFETFGPPDSNWRSGVGPLGTNLAGWIGGSGWPSPEQTPNSYTSRYRSGWSDPVTVIIPAAVPPPLLKRPVDNLAIPVTKNVVYEWQYRNAQDPPRPQARRTVQVREAGSPTWTNLLLNNVSASQTYTDPAGGTALAYEVGKLYEWRVATASSMSAPVDPNFELGTTDGWEANTGLGTVPVTNVTGSGADVYNGSRCALITGPYVSDFLEPFRRIYVSPGASCTAGVRVRRSGGSNTTGQVWVYWYDAAGTYITNAAGALVSVSTSWALASMTVTAPAGAAYGEFAISFGSITNATSIRLDAFTFTTSGPVYEASEFSDVGQFWITEGPGTGSVIPAPGETIDGATLGCGKHRAFIYRRGGKRRVGELTGLSSVDWGRVRDDISSAKIVVSDWGVDCGDLLAKLQTWAYELVIYRDNGYSNERVWEGPITKLTYETDKVTIDAKDVMAYAYRRIIKRAMNDGGWGSSGVSIIDRAETIILDTLGPDDPNVLGYLTPMRQDDDVKQYRNLPAYSRTAFEEIDDMAANSGLDYAAVGRRIILWGTKHRIGTLPEFRDEHLGAPPIVSEYGMSLANRYVVSDGNGVWGEAVRLKYDHLYDPGYDDVYGLVEMLSSSWASDSAGDTGTYTEAGKEKIRQSFAEASERSIADRYPPPVVVRIPDNTSLSPDTPVTIQQLVPGVAIPLRSVGTLRQVRGLQKLDSVTVNEVAGTETITITLSSFSRDDGGGEDPGEVGANTP